MFIQLAIRTGLARESEVLRFFSTIIIFFIVEKSLIPLSIGKILHYNQLRSLKDLFLYYIIILLINFRLQREGVSERKLANVIVQS